MAKCDDVDNYGNGGDKCLYVGTDGKLTYNVVGPTSSDTISSNNKVDDGLWHHVAVTINSGTGSGGGNKDMAKLYIDGECDKDDDDTDCNRNAETGPYALKIGYANGFSKYFDGRIDDARFYDYVLEEDYDQVAKLYEETGYWRFVVSGDSAINLASKGKWLTCYIQLPENYDVADIDPNSVFLEDEIKPEQFSVDEQAQVATARFSRSEVQNILNIGQVDLTINGQLTDGTRFEATVVIRVIDKGGGKSAK